MDVNIERLNRLRVNAGKPELRSWKAAQSKMKEAIQKLLDDGHSDALPGANLNATPLTTDPKIAAALKDPEEQEEPKSLADSAMAKNIANEPVKQEKAVTKVKAHLARGLDDDQMARQSRAKVRDLREKEKKDAKEKKVTLSKQDKRAIKEEAEARKKGQVDKTKYPDKAARQEQHIADKRSKRAAEGKLKETKVKDPNTITAADIARELDLDPKVARAKLRRHEDKLDKLRGKGMDRWTFPKSASAEIKKILKGGK